jgi:small-conductance mechanosensitive channel
MLMGQLTGMVQDPFVLLVPVLLFGGTVLVGIFIRQILHRTLAGWAERTDSHLAKLLHGTVRDSIVLWFAILGVHIATQNSKIPQRYLHYIPPTLALLWILMLTVSASRLAGNAVRFYGSRAAGDGEMRQVASLTQKLAQAVVVIFGIVWMLKVVFDINLTPVLATLGVGGLAVALALQDTLSNLFAGFWVSISGLLRIGDYIKLNTGEEGYVRDINWRCTTMRGISNNLVVIPNSKLGQAIFTNYFLPERRLVLSFSIGVGYGSDIDRVEAILLEETIAASGTIAGMVADPQPYVRFNPGPSDFSLIFQINFSVTEFGDQYKVQSELRKLIYKRLTREGIDMPYPTRVVINESRTGA